MAEKHKGLNRILNGFLGLARIETGKLNRVMNCRAYFQQSLRDLSGTIEMDRMNYKTKAAHDDREEKYD